MNLTNPLQTQDLKNNFSILVATINGSGSLTANQVLTRSLFRMGLPVGAKNLFPSNIAGLATWFTIRISQQGYTGRKVLSEVVVALNPATVAEDLKKVSPGGYFITSDEAPIVQKVHELLQKNNESIHHLAIPFKDLSLKATDVGKMRKLLINMIYVGLLAEWLEIPQTLIESVIHDQFKNKPHIVPVNIQAVLVGREYIRLSGLSREWPFKVKALENKNSDQILMDGNTASALGLLDGGCTFMAWYPITPSSSLAESFQNYADQTRKDSQQKNNFAVIQAEDELSAINMVIGAGWAGARAVTPTSGPGLSLMAEAAGLSYFAEIPAVIWNVQRAGPSTGLPTRTLQGDLLASYRLSHGDTEHIVLLPGSLQDCFEFGRLALDLAEEFQTLVIVLSDLDLGMNLWMSPKLKVSTLPLVRGKVLSAEALQSIESYARYKDIDGDGIPYRTRPGTLHDKAAYFTRGTAHTESSAYSEDSENFKNLLSRLALKMKTARKKVPGPIIHKNQGETGFLSYGSSHLAILEALDILAAQDKKNISYLQLRSLPLSQEVGLWIKERQRIYVIEQNRDGQLLQILRAEYSEWAHKFYSIVHFDGLPITAETILSQFSLAERLNHKASLVQQESRL